MNLSRRIGIISDTHGLLRPEALAALRGCGHIVHAGDIGGPDVLAGLGRIAPVVAVRGNVDAAGWARALPESVTVEVAGIRVHVRHILGELGEPDPAWDLVIVGHSHRPVVDRLAGAVLVNPGSAGRRRFSLPVTVAVADVTGSEVDAHVIELE